MKIIFLSFFGIPLALMLTAQQVIPLYENVIPNSKPSKDEEKSKLIETGIEIISNVSVPRLMVFLPLKEKAKGTAILICPGGGYSILAGSHEGTDVAKKFNEMGVAAFVLKYRIPNNATMVNKEVGPLQDAQRALQFLRQHAKQWNINPNRVGIMGFSAGGHLASTAGTHFLKPHIENRENVSLRPDFMVLIYPVISFSDSLGHIGSRTNLIGPNPSIEKIKEYSTEMHISSQTPPTFLVHAADDSAVKVENSLEFYRVLMKNKVPGEMHLYPRGGHGFGMNNPTTKDQWMDRLANWFEANGWLNVKR